MRHISLCTFGKLCVMAATLFLHQSNPGSFAALSSNLELRPAEGTYGGSTALQAGLTSGNRPLSGRQLRFSLNGVNAGTAITNSHGVATLNNVSLAGIQANTYAQGFTAVFTGARGVRGSQGTAALTVDKATASVTPNAAAKTYGTSDPALSGTLSGFLSSDNVTATYSRTADQNAGSYAISATLAPAGVLGNYQIQYNTAVFTVAPALLSVTANDATRLYRTANPSFTAGYSGFVNGDTVGSFGGTLSFMTNASVSSPVGTYAVTPGGLTSSNYTITFVNGTLNVVYAYVTDKKLYTPLDYVSFKPPAVGNSYIDTPGFYTPIRRLSDSMHTLDAAYGDGRPVTTIGTEYSTVSPFNEDNTRVLLQHFSYFGLYDGSGNFLNNLPFEISASAQPRWSRTDPYVLYYVSGNQLKQCNVATNRKSVVHTFAEYSSVTGKGKSDISFDGDHFVLVGDSEYVFVYEISTDSKGPVFDTAGTPFNAVFVTPDNNVMITWYQVGTDRHDGMELFDRNMNFLRQVARSDGHMDMTRDTNGDEVIVWINASDPQPICNNGVVKIRLADASETCLLTLDWSLAAHISGTDNSGWAFVETYAPGDPMPPSGWFPFTDELMQVKLDGTETRRLLHHRSRPFNGYSYQPKLSISRDGSRLAYGSNFGLQQSLGYPTEYADAYMVDVSVVSSDTLGTAY